MTTTAKGIPIPDETDSPDGPTQIAAVANWVDARPGVAPLTYAAINGLAGAALWTGRQVYQTDTGTNRPQPGLYTYNGIAWRLPWDMPWGLVPGGVSEVTNDSGTYTSFGTVAGLPITFTAIAGRYYEIRFEYPFHSTPTSGVDGAQAQLLDSASVLVASTFGADAGNDGHINLGRIVALSGGSHTINPQVGHGSSGTVGKQSSSALCSLTIKDVGPSSATPA